MMKHFIHTLLIIIACAWSVQINAQTPFDSFAPEVSRPMLELDKSGDKQPDSIVCAIVADLQSQMLLLVDISNGEIVSSAPITDDIRKWMSVDPLADEYPGVSPYAYCGWNPVGRIAPDGKSYSDFDEDGNYLGTSHDNWWHNTFVGQKGRILDSDGNVTNTFGFADPSHDVADLKSGKLNRIQFVQESDIVDFLKNAGAFDESNRGLLSRYIYAWNEGQAFGELDFAKKPNGLGPKYLGDTYNSLYLVGCVAHNPENFGNFLFGAAGVSLGINPSFLLIGGM